jgi:hypothetical protein
MANNSGDDGAGNNGFGRRFLYQWEGRLLHAAGYMAPLDFRAPSGWRLSTGGIPIPPPPTGAALDAAIDEVLETMSDEQCAEPRFYPDNQEAWTAFFRRRYERELVERARQDAGVRPPAHRGRERPRPRDATGAAADDLPPPREQLDATPDGSVRLVRDGVVRVGH